MTTTTPRLQLAGVTRHYPTGGGLTGVDLVVEPGSIHALVGLNGAGKSTLLKLALGMLRPDTGSVRIAGRDVAGAPSSLWAGVGHLVDAPFAYPELDVRTNLTISARLHGVPRHRIADVVAAGIAALDLGSYADRRASRLSMGNRQRVGLAAALQHRPALLVLDEPGNALDPRGVILLREAVRALVETTAAGVLVSSHHLDEVARTADRISVINDGRLIGTIDPRGVDIEREFFALVHDDVAATSGAAS
jgi:ABC-2 type transport system ATP-binding protein